MANNAAEPDFNTIFFEKKLTNLKDSQDSINNCCHWCLENHQHHKKIVSAWLTVLKRAKVEHRLTLFYLANDVIQYSKRRNLHFVESWGTTLQKATTMVRDEKVKHKILRIFKIWEQRGIYGEEFITDLSGLISASPSTKKSEEPHEFQSSYLIPKIRNCAKLEADTDLKLKKFKEHHPKMMDLEALCSSLKDRAHVDDVEKEMDEFVAHIESYINALKTEIKSRNNLISLLTQADVQLANDKKDVKLVANAYKTFASRVKGFKKKLDEIIPSLNSPTPSPDINAPSPSPDSEIDLPVTDSPKTPTTEITQSIYTNAGFYNPVPPPNTESNTSFINNGFSSFMGTTMPFNIESLNASLFTNSPSLTSPQVTTACQTQTTDVYSTNNSISSLFPSIVQPPPPPAPVPAVTPSTDYQYGSTQIPLMPPPIPPFNKVDGSYSNSSSYSNTYNSESNPNYGNTSYDQPSNNYSSNNGNYPQSITPYQQSQPATTYPQSVTSYQSQEPTTSYPQPVSNYQNASYETPVSSFQNTTYPPPPPPPVGSSYAVADEYNPEQEPETWENESTWEQPPIDLETPESPPIFEKESYSDPVEYHDNQSVGAGCDIDHRVLSVLPTKNNSDSDKTHRKTDVDHRNLISLTGSPKEIPVSLWTNQTDQDYRTSRKTNCDADQDYRISFNFENLKLPPPPPPPNQGLSPNKSQKKSVHSPRKILDNVESIDMDLSEDDNDDNLDSDNTQEMVNDNLRVVTLVDNVEENSLEPPPPFPIFSDEADANANNLLDDLNNDLDDSEDLISALGEECDEMDVLPLMPNFELAPPWNNRFPPGPGEPNGFPNRPPNFPLNAPLQYPPPMRNLNWMEPGFNQEFSAFPGRGNKRGNFSNRGDFRGRPRGFVWRGRPNFRGNNRGGPMRGAFNRGMIRTRPFFRGRFRGGYQN